MSVRFYLDKIWEAWSDWTECGASCGGSLQYRFRRCMRNKRCFGPRRETKICNLAPCSPGEYIGRGSIFGKVYYTALGACGPGVNTPVQN